MRFFPIPKSRRIAIAVRRCSFQLSPFALVTPKYDLSRIFGRMAPLRGELLLLSDVMCNSSDIQPPTEIYELTGVGRESHGLLNDLVGWAAGERVACMKVFYQKELVGQRTIALSV